MFRTLRLLALLKMERQTGAFDMIATVLELKSVELTATLFMAFVLMMMASTAMYYAENAEQPEEFSSIPCAMWWSVTALTTVGYGDIYPTTVQGKCLGCVVAFLGVGLFALPSGIVSSGFVEMVNKQREEEAEELAEMIDSEANKLNGIETEIGILRKSVENIQSGAKADRQMTLDVLHNQRLILEHLQRAVPGVTLAASPKSSGAASPKAAASPRPT